MRAHRRVCLTRRNRAVLMAALVMAVGLLVTVDGGSPSTAALGPVQPITPVQTSPQMEVGTRADLSRRGEAVTAVHQFAEDRGNGAFIGLDNATIEAPFAAGEVGVSGDGCVAAFVLGHTPPPPPPPSTTVPPPPPTSTPPIFIGLRRPAQTILDPVPVGLTRIATIDRCSPANSRILAELSTGERPFGQPAVNFDGSVVVVPTAANVMRFDIAASVARTNLPAAGLDGWVPFVSWDDEANLFDNPVDVSADGSVVVATLIENCDCDAPRTVIVAWRAGSASADVVSTPDGSLGGRSYSPSVSGDGAFVSFVSQDPLAGQPATPNRAWVHVRPLAAPTFTMVSPLDEIALYSSISEDGSQVAFVRTRPACSAAVVIAGCVPNPDLVVSVVWSAVPGLDGPRQTEDINRAASGAISSLHLAPVLSGSGRYVAWETQGGATLLGQDFPDEFHVMLRERDAGFRVDDIDFGTRTAGSSTTASTTVTNTGRSSILPGQILTSAPQFVVTGGSCGVDVWLPPGATCTVQVRFDAPAGSGAFASQLVVREVGYEALAASGRLTANVVVPPPDTPPTTTVPPATATVVLFASPNPADFGPVAILIPTAVTEITVSNAGNTAAPIQLFVTGAHATDFQLVSDSCRVAPLQPGRTCVVRIRMLATAGGPRTATLDVISGSASTAVGLVGEGRLAPQLAASPAAITQRGYTTIVGQGFVPGEAVSIEVDGMGITVPATAGSDGTFQAQLAAFGQLPLGPYELVVPARPGFYDEVRATLVVVLGTYQPQGPTSVVFRDNLLVVRGN